MSIYTCKMCGGTIEFEAGETVGYCDSCNAKQTLPKPSDEKKANLYIRANQLRRVGEYDKAASIYEQILGEDATDAESYFSLVLCKYGIEYVDDINTSKKIPTINRTQFASIFTDENYKLALSYADDFQREVYEEEARRIDEIQKDIIKISDNEEPFDIFICYKETDDEGRRTPDSVLAVDLYHQLTNEGYRVFFSRITLEDKLGTEYEPYIFAALNSAKVMLVLGTKPEYFQSVWVRNEWSRFLTLAKNSEDKKVLIPAYKDMDPYDLPIEFSNLQAQDMSKLGFMQDLIRGIKKIVGEPKNKEKSVVKRGLRAFFKETRLLVTGIIGAVLITIAVLFAVGVLPGDKESSDTSSSLNAENIKKLVVGDTIELGTYEQNNLESDGKEKIEWQVIATGNDHNKLLVVSKYAIDCREYNSEYADVTWESSSIRSWLNKTFISEAFDEDERKYIVSSELKGANNTKYDTFPGRTTTDKIFLLSIYEVEKYFTSSARRVCEITPYAASKGAYTSAMSGGGDALSCWWWLRSPGSEAHFASYIDEDGDIYLKGGSVYGTDVAIRPAMWISLDGK